MSRFCFSSIFLLCLILLCWPASAQTAKDAAKQPAPAAKQTVPASELARGFQGEAPRAAAVIAIARAVLNDKNAPVPTSQPAKN